jgi:hypothetical protein
MTTFYVHPACYAPCLAAAAALVAERQHSMRGGPRVGCSSGGTVEGPAASDKVRILHAAPAPEDRLPAALEGLAAFYSGWTN